MQLHECLEAHRERLAKRHDQGDVSKGSFIFWFYVLSLAIQVFKLWRGK
jgi:hypothetical protein